MIVQQYRRRLSEPQTIHRSFKGWQQITHFTLDTIDRLRLSDELMSCNNFIDNI